MSARWWRRRVLRRRQRSLARTLLALPLELRVLAIAVIRGGAR